MVDWLTLAVPFAYLGILIGSLATFSSLYRRRKAARASALAPWFPSHIQRDIYFSLLHLEQPSTSGKGNKIQSVPETVLKAALLRRATEDINRVMMVREQKQALTTLLQRGSVGDDLWQRFLRAEKEMEEEVRDVVSEANTYVPNWGQIIFQSAKEMTSNNLFRQRIHEYQSKVSEEREWWDCKKASIQESFMKELEQEEQSKKASNDNKLAPPSQTSRPSTTPPLINGSDDDAVLVEAEAPAPTPSGGKKKKKSKK